MWLTWIDDCVAIGEESVVARELKILNLFECKDIGPMEEYVSSKVEITSGQMKFKQPVLLQSFVNEFGVDKNEKVNLLAVPGQVLIKEEDHKIMEGFMCTKYRLGVSKNCVTWRHGQDLIF
jgi:hypothetical protein